MDTLIHFDTDAHPIVPLKGARYFCKIRNKSFMYDGANWVDIPFDASDKLNDSEFEGKDNEAS